MIFPVGFHAGPLSVSAHYIFESLAYALGFSWYRRLRRKQGDFLASPDRASVVVAAILGAALGSKVLYWFEDPALTLAHWFDIPYLLAGKTIVGGLLGSTLAVEWIKRRSGITRRTGDLFALPMAASIAIGRIGCFVEGLPDHTYGIATGMPWGVDFGDGIRRHPTQLYETLSCYPSPFFWRATDRAGKAISTAFSCSLISRSASPSSSSNRPCQSRVSPRFNGRARRLYWLTGGTFASSSRPETNGRTSPALPLL